MTKSAHKILLLLVALVVPLSSLADPVTAIIGLLVADNINPSNAKPQTKNHYTWRELLTTDEARILPRLEMNPVVQTCSHLADEGNAIAAYHMRKIADFAVRLDRYIKDNGSVPTIRSMDYHWPARGMQWCEQQYGQQSADSGLSLHAYALRLTTLVQGLPTGQTVVVAQQH